MFLRPASHVKWFHQSLLFQLPLPEPCVRLSTHTALQLMTATQVQVPAHLVPFPLFSVISLPPFVLSQALPQAFGYYGGSVALRLAPCRRSRICLCETSSTCRCPVHFLEPVHCRSLTAESVR
jgi:hypothetical protein